jgi:hypothetical protein
VAFERELDYIQDELERLKYQNIIPESLSGIFVTVQVNALGVLSAMLDLVGEQLTYLETFAAKFGTSSYKVNGDFVGRVVINLVTDSGQVYQNAGRNLKEMVAKFNQSLTDAAFEAGMGNFRFYSFTNFVKIRIWFCMVFLCFIG